MDGRPGLCLAFLIVSGSIALWFLNMLPVHGGTFNRHSGFDGRAACTCTPTNLRIEKLRIRSLYDTKYQARERVGRRTCIHPEVWPSDLPAVAMSPRDLIAMSHTDVSEGCPEGMYLSYLPLTVWPGPRACRAPGIHTPRGVPLVIGLTYGWPRNMHFSFYVRLLLVDCHFL